MIIISFNVRGIGGPQKTISLKRMILSLKPDIIMLQEKMCTGENVRDIVEPWLRNWSFNVVDA
jgi:exonuclease III